MSLTSRTIASNTGFYVAALAIQKIFAFVYFSIVARTLGVATTGKYSFALALAAIVMALMDFGMTPMIIREVSKKTPDRYSLFHQALTIKCFLTLLTLTGAAVAVSRAIPDPLQIQLVILALAIAVADSFTTLFFAVIRAHQNLVYESISAIGFQIVVFGFGLTAIALGYDVRAIMTALLVGSIFNTAFSLWVLMRRLQVPIRFVIDYGQIRRLIALTYPFAVAAIFLKLYAYVDTVMLKFMSGDSAVGLYSVAYKITFAFQFIPLAFIAALYPAFSLFWHNQSERLSLSFTKSLHYLLLISLPMTFGIFAIADKIIPQVYTQSFQDSVLPLIILMASLPFLFLNFPVGSLLNACNRQMRQTGHLVMTTIVNIILNVLLIPIFGPVGAALASSISTVFIFVLGIYVANQIVAIDFLKVGFFCAKLLISSVVMMVFVRWFEQMIPQWYLSIPPAVALYGALILLMRIITVEDIRKFKSLIRP